MTRKRSGQQRKHPRKVQARLDAMQRAFDKDHAPKNNPRKGPAFTRPGSRKK